MDGKDRRALKGKDMVGDEVLLHCIVDIIDEVELTSGSSPAYIMAITTHRILFFNRGGRGFAGVMGSIFSGKWEARASKAMSEQDLSPLFEGDPEPRTYLREDIRSIGVDRGKVLASGLEITVDVDGRKTSMLFSFPKRYFSDVIGVLELHYRGLVHQTTGLLSMSRGN